MAVTTRRDGATGLVEIDSPPVNAIGQADRQGLLDAVRWAEAEGLERVIVTGKGRAFVAGADAREFDKPPADPHLPDVLNAIDESAVPWIAAINGVALGGGAELAMVCRMRVMAPGAQIGLPEVNLGVIPGAGGTQRLPRLVGLAKALEMISTGKPISAEAAQAAGLVDMVDAGPVAAAGAVPLDTLRATTPTWQRPQPASDPAVIAAARAQAEKKSKGQIAPQRAIDVIEAGLTLPFHQALAIERETFFERRNHDQSRALRHIFFAERATKPPEWLTADPVALEHVAVVGGGTMGAGIAYALLNAGLAVTLIETGAEAVARAEGNIGKIIDASLKRGLIDEAGAEARRARLTLTDDASRAATATLAIEAAFESMEVKRAVMTELQASLPKEAILATNTSYLDIDEIAGSVTDPSRVLGLHFFAPAHIMRLLEIVRGAQTSDAALATGYALAKRLRKVPVLAGVCDGFIGNRIYARYREAADTVVMDGATPWQVDRAMEDFGYAMGPYEAQDLSGLDIAYANRRRQDATRDPNRRYIPIADKMVEAGRLGRKTGAGWYRYENGVKVEDDFVTELAEREAGAASVPRRVFTDEEIRDRLLLAMINEAAQILAERIAQNARDIDLVTVFGYGFPRWRGGLMHHADTMGAGVIVDRLTALAREDPIAWSVSGVLKDCADRRVNLAEWRVGG